MRVTTVSLEQLKALGSPVRQRLIDALVRRGESSAGELAETMGVERSSLYYHLRILVDAELVEDLGARPATTRREHVYRAVGGRMRLAGDPDPEYRAAVLALYEMDLRGLSSVLSDSLERDPTGREHLLLRYRVHLDDAGLEELQELFARIDELVREQGVGGEGRAHRVWLVHVPEE